MRRLNEAKPPSPQFYTFAQKVSLFNPANIMYNILEEMRGGITVPNEFETTKLNPIQESGNEAQDILMYVYSALQAKGYDPITQLVGYIISGDPTYITSHNQARSMICRLERDEILEELVRFYLAEHTEA